jgi:hypothetical protein
MENDKAIEVMRRVGDPIEKYLADFVEPLNPVLYPYAGIWADHILLRRRKGAPSFAADDWMPFAGSHYTAMIRVYHAWRKYECIQHCCKAVAEGEQSPAVLLDAHDAFACFWEHIGSAIDNLALCFQDAPCIREANGSKYIQKRYQFLDYCYDRRTQFIHSRLIPKGIDGGILYFNLRLLDRKDTEWRPQFEQQEIVEDHYRIQWKRFMAEMGDAWEHLRNWLRNEDKHRPVVKEVQMPASFDPDAYARMVTENWGHVDAPSTIKIAAPRDAIKTQEVKPINVFPDIPPSGTR